MKKKVLSLLGMAMAFLLPSCLEFETKVTLNKDGSGTITEEIIFGQQMAGMLDMAAAQGGENPLAQMKSKEEGQKKAAAFGNGVTFVKAEDIKTKAGGKGVRLTYNFKDINEVTLNPAGDMSALNAMPGQGLQAKPDAGEKASFRYNNGRLTINLPAPEEEEGEAVEPEALQPDDPQAAMMAEMLKGMKMSVKVVAADGIAETTASHHKDGTITLLEMNMDEVMKNPDGLGALGKLQGKKPDELTKAMKNIKGVKAETQKEVVVILK
jgi:hypothetical protein